MAAVLEQDEFAKHLNTKFRIQISEAEAVEAELTEVSELSVTAQQARFAITFRTPNKPFLGQGLHRFDHDQMGPFELFIVPVEQDDKGTNYEAIFNRVIEQ